MHDSGGVMIDDRVWRCCIVGIEHAEPLPDSVGAEWLDRRVADGPWLNKIILTRGGGCRGRPVCWTLESPLVVAVGCYQGCGMFGVS